jgi:FkbM family methyltransferase
MARSPGDCKITAKIVEWGSLAEQFVLIDVGAGGGIGNHWLVFGEKLRAYAFEPLLGECERLSRLSGSDRIQYFPYFVGDGKKTPESKRIAEGQLRNRAGFFARSSAFLAEQLLQERSIERIAGEKSPQLSNTFITLDSFAEEQKLADLDFLKIDTDGSDYDVLNGAREILNRKNVLGITVEFSFNAPAGAGTIGLFPDVDRFCKERGYSLYDLSPRHISRKQLPAPFVYSFPAETLTGPVDWGDALYIKDFCDPGYLEKWPQELSDQKLVKLACIFEIFELPDCAAELILTFPETFEKATGNRTEQLLDLLTPSLRAKQFSYRQYNEHFRTNLQDFYNGCSPELEAVYNSRSWRITKPLRRASHFWRRLRKIRRN